MEIQNYLLFMIPSYIFHLLSILKIHFSKFSESPRYIPHIVLAFLPLLWLVLIPIMIYQRKKKYPTNIAEQLLVKKK